MPLTLTPNIKATSVATGPTDGFHIEVDGRIVGPTIGSKAEAKRIENWLDASWPELKHTFRS